MSNFDESFFSIQPEATYGDFLDLDENGNPIRLDPNQYALSTEDELCFKCTLPDCKENSKKCLINIAKAEAKVRCGGCDVPVCLPYAKECQVNELIIATGNG